MAMVHARGCSPATARQQWVGGRHWAAGRRGQLARAACSRGSPLSWSARAARVRASSSRNGWRRSRGRCCCRPARRFNMAPRGDPSPAHRGMVGQRDRGVNRRRRSRVGALVAAMPTPERVTAVNGASYPARSSACIAGPSPVPPVASCWALPGRRGGLGRPSAAAGVSGLGEDGVGGAVPREGGFQPLRPRVRPCAGYRRERSNASAGTARMRPGGRRPLRPRPPYPARGAASQTNGRGDPWRPTQSTTGCDRGPGPAGSELVRVQ
jgi:hypothetical protein